VLTLALSAAAITFVRWAVTKALHVAQASGVRTRASRWLVRGDAAAIATRLVEVRIVKRAHMIAALARSVATFAIVAVAATSILHTMGVDIAKLLTAAGVLGVVLGFGAQTLIKDILAGLFMILEEQCGVGDVVDLGNVTGTVEALGLRVTRVRADDGTLWYVRNGEVLRVGNRTQDWSRAVVEFRIDYDDDIDLAQKTLLAAAHDVVHDERYAAMVLDGEEPEILGIEALTADSVLLRLRVKVVPSKQWEVARALRASARVALAGQGISLAFQRRELVLDAEAGPATLTLPVVPTAGTAATERSEGFGQPRWGRQVPRRPTSRR
jgi:moderate conductance mechanosensitive channel